jgi:hypothetical protein
VEFGREVLIQEAEKGFITNVEIFSGHTGEAILLLGAIKKHKKIFGRVPEEVAADRGFYNKTHLEKIHRLGVRRISIPARGKKESTK